MSQLSTNASSRLQPATAPLATSTQAPPTSPSFTDVFAASFNDTITASIQRGLLDEPSTFDPNYRLTDAELTRMSVGVDPAILEDLYSEAQSVRSSREADALRSKFLTATENRRTIAQAGIPGLVVYGGTQIFDPPTVIASLASGGLAQAGNAAKLSKIAMAGRMALIDASAQAGLETIRAIENPNFDAGDVASGAVSGVFTQLGIGLRGPSILSGVAGGAIGASAGTFIGESVFNDDATLAQIGTSSLIAAVMGGTFGAAAGPNTLDNAVVRESHAFAKQVDTEALADAIVTQPLTEKGRRVVKQAQRARQERVAQMRNAAFDDDNPDAFMYPDAPSPPRDAARTDVPPSEDMTDVGGGISRRTPSAQTAAADEPPRPPKTALDLDLSDTTDAATSSGFTGVRFGMLYRAGRSAIGEIRRLANMLGRDILRKTDGTETLTSASQWVQRSHAAAYVAVQDAVDEAVAAVRRADPSRSRVDVERAITAGIEGSGPVTPEIANAVTAGRKLFEDLLATMHRHGVPGAGKTKADPFYVPHAALRSRIDELVNRITDAGGNGKAEMIEWVQETLRSGFEGITRKDGSPMPNDNKLKAYATAWVENAGRRGPMRQLGNVAKSRQEMVDEFIRRYQGVFGELDEADQDRIADIFDAMQGGEDEARFTRLRNALPLDMSARRTFSDGTTVSMADLHERNFLALAASYSRRAHGHAAIAAVAEAMGRPGASADELLAWAASLQRQFESANPDRSLGAKWRNQRERDNIARLDALLRSVTGAPIREETTASNLAAALRSYNFVNLLSTPLAAINNSAEVVASLRVSGIRASLKTGGKALERTWYKIMRDARAGTLGKAQHDAIARLGIAQDFAASRILERSVPGDVPASELRRVMQRMQRASYIVSGQQFVEEQGRAFTAISLMQRLSDLADSGVSDAHLRSIGFTRQQWDRIAGQIRKHRTMESGIFGDTLGAFNVDSWDEGFSQDASRLLNAIAKQSSMLVLQPSAEQMDLWMTGEAGKILLQLRSYMIAANDVLLRGGQDIKDPRAGLLGLMLAGSFASAMAYTQREYINSLFQDDPQKYRDERLTLNNIALQGWGRTAFSTYLPFVIDTSLQVSGNKPVFAQGRVSQIGQTPGISGALTSNPTSSTIDTAGRAIVGAGRAALLERERFTQPDANYWLRLMPNAFFVRDALRQFTKDLPDDDTPDF